MKVNAFAFLVGLLASSIQAHSCSKMFSAASQSSSPHQYLAVGAAGVQLSEEGLFLVSNATGGLREISGSLEGDPIRLVGQVRNGWFSRTRHDTVLVETSNGLEYLTIDPKGRVTTYGLIPVAGSFHQVVFNKYLVFSKGNSVYFARMKFERKAFKELSEETKFAEVAEGEVEAIRVMDAGVYEGGFNIESSTGIQFYNYEKFLGEILRARGITGPPTFGPSRDDRT